MHFIAVDPGLVCGVAVLTLATGPDIEGGIAATMSSHEKPWRNAVQYVNMWCVASDMASSTTFVAERFDIMPGRRAMTPQPEALMTIGALDYILSQCEITLRLQPRAEVKKVVNDNVLHRLGWFKKTKDGHANDAARHVGFLLHQTHPVMWLRLLGSV